MIKLSHQLAETTCKVLKQRRLSLLLSQDELAQRTGLARSYICDVERGNRHPTLHNLTVISDALEWNPSELVRETEIQVTQLLDPDKLLSRSAELTDLEQEIVHYTNNRMSQGVIITNAKGEFVLYTQAATQLVGLGLNDTTPDEWADAYGCFRLDRVTPFPSKELPVVKVLDGSVTFTDQMFLRNAKLPAGRCIEVHSRQIRDPQSGALKGAIAIIEELKR